MRKIELAVWDGDNTIWNWMDYAVPAYEAMCGVIADFAGKSFDETAEAMKRFYTLKGTLEDEGLVQGLRDAGFFSHLENFDMDECIASAQSAFSKVRKENLKVYDGIAETIKMLHERGIRQIILTDAPANQAQARLLFSKLDGFIDAIHSMPAAEIPDLPERFVKNRRKGISQFNLPAEKPHVDLEKVLLMTREEIAAKVAIIGDNMAKDMALAGLYGCLGIHAAYGAAGADLIERIKRFAPERVAARNTQVDSGAIVNGDVKTANSPEEIFELLGLR